MYFCLVESVLLLILFSDGYVAVMAALQRVKDPYLEQLMEYHLLLRQLLDTNLPGWGFLVKCPWLIL